MNEFGRALRRWRHLRGIKQSHADDLQLGLGVRIVLFYGGDDLFQLIAPRPFRPG